MSSWKVNNSCEQVVDDVRTLGALAAHMRRRRFAGGALRLDNVKLVFRLGADGNPAAARAACPARGQPAGGGARVLHQGFRVCSLLVNHIQRGQVAGGGIDFPG